RFPTGLAVAREKLAGLVGEIDQDGTGFEQRHAVVAIDDRRNTIIRADFEKLGLELVTLADVDRVGRVGEPDLLQHDRRLAAVWGGPRIKIYHRMPRVRFLSAVPRLLMSHPGVAVCKFASFLQDSLEADRQT